MNKPERLVYNEDFSFDLSSADALKCSSADVRGNVLRGRRACKALDEREDYMGIAGVAENSLYVYSNRFLRRYDGQFHTVTSKLYVNGVATSQDARSDEFRDSVYFAFDGDGVLRCNEKISDFGFKRWAVGDSVADVAAVNERLAALLADGVTVSFSDCNDRLFSELEDADSVQYVKLPSVVQAICRRGSNVLYALGNACYKLTFSAEDKEIKVERIADNVGEVVMHTVKEIGSDVVFASKDRLYVLRNDRVSPVFDGLSVAIGGYKGCRASAWRGKYVLSVPRGEARCAYVLDVSNGKCDGTLYGGLVDVTVYDGSDVTVSSNGKLAQTDPDPDAYAPVAFFRSGIDFLDNRVKFLRRLTLCTKYDVEAVLTDGDGVSRVYRVCGKDGVQTLNVQGRGRAFSLLIRSSGQTEVSRLTLTAEAYKEGYYGS